jgi:hypothetical protein
MCFAHLPLAIVGRPAGTFHGASWGEAEVGTDIRSHLTNTRSGVEKTDAPPMEKKKPPTGGPGTADLWAGHVVVRRSQPHCGDALSSRLVAGPNLWPRHLRLFMRWLLGTPGGGMSKLKIINSKLKMAGNKGGGRFRWLGGDVGLEDVFGPAAARNGGPSGRAMRPTLSKFWGRGSRTRWRVRAQGQMSCGVV